MLARIFGLTRSVPDLRAAIVEVLSDIAGETLGRKAAECFDDPERFEQLCAESHTEPPWMSDDRDPTPGERAAGIFFQLLQDEGRSDVIDWAYGGTEVVHVIQELLRKAGAECFGKEELEQFTALAGNAGRGKAFAKLDGPLKTAVQKRGLVLAYLDRDADAYFPILVSPEVHAKWSKLRFDADHRIL
ncbi:hypothetical protein D0B54_00100 [Solimonas sp. K1W22B-7]|uniref:DUF6630 family protein n=1 Tax=Solimonas sp. K1W22B-7 TaxID=2303331 RepID=UPI000E32E8F8|nr:hypothetical protein [Solimonas sp. K1W22B-7]AXQ27187.1 hypothetical protein D0B54_00100 [Solimonas sp. K1W22B-7]